MKCAVDIAMALYCRRDKDYYILIDLVDFFR